MTADRTEFPAKSKEVELCQFISQLSAHSDADGKPDDLGQNLHHIGAFLPEQRSDA